MALFTITDVQNELSNIQRGGDFDDDLLLKQVNGVWSLWCTLTDRAWDAANSPFTEYLTVYNYNRKVLALRELGITAITSIHNDTDGWDYEAGDLVAASGYDFDASEGLVFFKTALTPGLPRSVRVIYAAGYTETTLPADIKQALIRQAAHWYKQAKNFSGYERLESLMDEFLLLTRHPTYRRKYWHERH